MFFLQFRQTPSILRALSAGFAPAFTSKIIAVDNLVAKE